MISNIYSLLSTKWFIDPSMKNTLLPQLRNVLEGNLVQGKANYPTLFTTTSTIAGTKDNPSPNAEDQYVAVIPIKGGIYKYNQFCGPTGTQSIGKQIQAYDRDSNCVGIVLDVDSGGGQVSGTPELYDIIQSIETPIETYTDGYLCSAAYYIASATNKIIANKRADKIGSIGTMVYFIDLEGYYKAKGATVVEEYATQSKDKNKPVRELLKGNPELYIKEELDPITEEFISDVKSQRSTIKEEVFTGATYSPKKAQEMGLIDSLGTLKGIVNGLLQSKSKDKQSNSMSKKITLTALTAALAVEALESTDKGTYFNEEQLATLNTALAEGQTAVETLTASVTAETNKATEANTRYNAVLAAAGIEATADQTADQASLLATIAELQGKPGNAHTGAKGNPTTREEEENSIIDANAGHNQLLNKILK